MRVDGDARFTEPVLRLGCVGATRDDEEPLYVRLVERNERGAWNGPSVVYHDEFGDGPTNEPIMAGTANQTWLLTALAVTPPWHAASLLPPR